MEITHGCCTDYHLGIGSGWSQCSDLGPPNHPKSLLNVPEKDRIIFEEELVIDKEINKKPANWVDQVEMIGETGEPMNWVDQVEKLWEAGELVVTSKWKPGEFKASGCPHPKCIENKSGQGKEAFNHHIITTHLPWFAYP